MEDQKVFYATVDKYRKSWYPIFPSQEVKTDTVHGLHLLGDPIVLYRDPKTLKTVCLEDRCAHRSVPLSVGRIMDGKLECRYHGWQYDPNGLCSHIPSLPRDRKIPVNCKVRVYPTIEANGWMWVWPSAEQPDEDPSFYFPWEGCDLEPVSGYIDLDIDHSLLVENFLDPAHLPFTHDTTIGKRSDATPMTIDCQFSKDGIKGVSSTLERPDMVITVFEFRPPVNVSIKFVFPNKPTKMDQSFYCVPTKKGHCRFVWLQRFSFISPWLLQIPVLGSYIRSKMEAYNRKVVMEDYKMLKGQQERLSAGANAMNAPVQADLMVKTYRNWWRLSKKTGFWFKGYSTDIEDIVLS